MTQIYLFPGQGSQKQGMGEDLFERFPDDVELADEVLGYSIKDLCQNNPDERLSQTQFTQPALYFVNHLSLKAKIEEDGKPDYAAGHSLGEYNALQAAGVFNYEAGLRIVKKRADLMTQAKGGGMAAVLGMEANAIEARLKEKGYDSIDVANYNSSVQTVISGPLKDIENAVGDLADAGAKRVVQLQVSGAFHSRYMREFANEFKIFLTEQTFQEPSFPVLANCTAAPYTKDLVVELLSQQLYSSVLWVDTIHFLKGLPEPEFSEIGPGRVLTGLLRYIH